MVNVPASHSAAILPKPQAQHVIEAWPTPSLGPDEILVKINATAINPVDWVCYLTLVTSCVSPALLLIH